MPTKSFAAYDGVPVAFWFTTQPKRISTCGKVGARYSKEVARMIKINRTMTAQSPAFGDVQVSTCVRVRHIGDMGLATATGFPGTTAWRPPTC